MNLKQCDKLIKNLEKLDYVQEILEIRQMINASNTKFETTTKKQKEYNTKVFVKEDLLEFNYILEVTLDDIKRQNLLPIIDEKLQFVIDLVTSEGLEYMIQDKKVVIK